MNFNCYLLVAGGYILEPIVEKLSFSTEDEEYDTDEFQSFTEYVEYCIAETRAEYEQKYASTILLTESQFEKVQNFGKNC